MKESFAAKLHINREEVIRFCETHDRVFLFGVGLVAEKFYLYLSEENIKIEGFVVSPGRKDLDSYKGLPVFEIDCINLEKTGIILSVSEKFHSEIRVLLEQVGIDTSADVYFQKIFFPNDNNTVTSEDAYNGVSSDGNYFKCYTQLDTLGIETGTDKNSQKHNYLKKYEFFLGQYRDSCINVLELGVFRGESLKMWEKYFSKAHITGVDIDSECKKYETSRVNVEIIDLSLIENLEYLGKKYEPEIIVEDASHLWSHQIKAFVTLFPFLRSGGVFIMEDLGTSFGRYRKSEYADSVCSGYEFFSALLEMVEGKEIVTNTKVKELFMYELEELAMTIDMISIMYGSIVVVKK